MARQQRLPGAGSGEDGPVTCLGQTFESEDARREHFLERLAEHLKDPEFRSQPGFPKGTDEAILRMSDPPYYTACPNPFLPEIAAHICTPYDPEADDYERVPISDDMEEGKKHPVYLAHRYHTKVPHLAIVPYLLHYTDPGDVVLDGFGGSGMTGVAALVASGLSPPAERAQITSRLGELGLGPVSWGSRYVVLNDLSPAATFMAATYTLPFDIDKFEASAAQILDELDAEYGWMYETEHHDGRRGRINYTVWSEVYLCPECQGELVYVNEAFNLEERKVAKAFNCRHCNAVLRKRQLRRVVETVSDPLAGGTFRRTKRIPVLLNYSVGGKKYEKSVDDADLRRLSRIKGFPSQLPHDRMMHWSGSAEACWGDKWRNGTANFSHVHHLYLERPAHAIGAYLAKLAQIQSRSERNAQFFLFEQILWGMSVMNKYVLNAYSQKNRYQNGVFYVASTVSEVHPRLIVDGTIREIRRAFKDLRTKYGLSFTQTGTCASIALPDNCVDYIFTDPPFGHNIAYSELNFIVEAFHKVFTQQTGEAVVSKHQGKEVDDYRTLMLQCFREYHRVLKPGRWMTLVFSNSRAAVWNAINESLTSAGFVVSNVRSFSKAEGSGFNANNQNYVDHDLAVTIYKPRHLQESTLEGSSDDVVWKAVDEHLAMLPVWIGTSLHLTVDLERSPDYLYDRLVTLHLVRGRRLGLDKNQFIKGLRTRYQEREGMFFLASQIPQFERKMLSVDRSEGVLPVFLDRRSAIAWLRAELGSTPTTLQKLTPRFMQASSAWADKNEPLPELLELLQDNFVEGENGRWKVPDPKKQAELERAKRQRDLRKAQDWAGAQGRGDAPSVDAIRTLLEWMLEEDRLDLYRSIKGRIPAGYLEDETLSMLVFVLNGRLND